MILDALVGDNFFAHVSCIERNFLDGLVEARIAIPLVEGLKLRFGFAFAEKLIDALGKILTEQEEMPALVLQEEMDFVILGGDDNFALHFGLPPIKNLTLQRVTL